MDEAMNDADSTSSGDFVRQRSNSAPPCSPTLKALPPIEEQTARQNISVACRFRPENVEEIKVGKSVAIFDGDGRTVFIRPADRPVVEEHRYQFSRVFQPHTEQHELFAAIGSPVVSGMMDGINCSVVAYGQTGSGKTFTMMGRTDGDTGKVVGNEGLIPRIIHALFGRLCQVGSETDIQVDLSFLEVYMEKVFDLVPKLEKVSSSQPNPPPPANDASWMHTRPDGSVVINHMTAHPVASEDRAMKLVQEGLARRRTSATKSNVMSSRSHAVLLLTMQTKNLVSMERTVVQMYLADLAGSEKMAKTEAEGLSVDEAKTINTSLFALGKVVSALSAPREPGSPPPHIPFRDSKLTRLLANSLHGNARSFVVLTCSPSAYNETETMSTLRFGMQAQRISTRPRKIVTRTVAELETLLRQAEAEMTVLRGNAEYLKAQLRVERSRRSTGDVTSKSGKRASTASRVSVEEDSRDLEELVSMVHRSLECPLRGKPMVDPVVALDGYTYERGAIYEYLLSHDMRSPMTGAQLTAMILSPNRTLLALRQNCRERQYTPTGLGVAVSPSSPFTVALLIRKILDYFPLVEWSGFASICSDFARIVYDREFWAPILEERIKSLNDDEQREIRSMNIPAPTIYRVLAQHRHLNISLSDLRSRQAVTHKVHLLAS